MSRKFKIINPLGSVEGFIDDIVSCSLVASSSLHGLVVADAYGIPNVWVKFSDSIGGDGMKYWDHLAATGRATLHDPPSPLDLRDGAGRDESWWNEMRARFHVGHLGQEKVEALWDACPFKP